MKMINAEATRAHDADQPANVIDINAGRRAFIRSLGFGAAGAAFLGAGALHASEALAAGGAPALSDATILKFALNLEYLEAEFYLRAVRGRGLDAADITGGGNPGRVIGGRQVAFDTRAVRQYALEIASDEEAHVKFLRAGLGAQAVARPKIDLKNSFTAAARAAGLIGPTDEFDAFGSETNFLLAAFIFEDVGVTAYKGAARFISNPDILEAAAGILAVEAYHAGEIRTLLFARGLSDQSKAISNLRDAVDGNSDLDQGVANRRGKANIVPTDQNGIAFSRSPRQVLNIVYLGKDAEKGGFFPNGLNGPLQ
jgi:hypothetical protein